MSPPPRGMNNRGYRHPNFSGRGNHGRGGRGRGHGHPHAPPQEPAYWRDYSGTSRPSRGRTPNGPPNRDSFYNNYNQCPRENEYPMGNEYYQEKAPLVQNRFAPLFNDELSQGGGFFKELPTSMARPLGTGTHWKQSRWQKKRKRGRIAERRTKKAKTIISEGIYDAPSAVHSNLAKKISI